MTLQQLLDNSLWRNGPQFLQQVTLELSDTNDIPTDGDCLHELKRESDKTRALSLDSTLFDSLLSISNNYSKLIQVHDDCLSNIISEEGIKWEFLPPRAPYFGGLWEAGVKSFKFHFKHVVGVSKLTFEEFYAILHHLEGILNSRPLTPLSRDMDDLEVLAPGHFLIGSPITAIAEPNLTYVENNLLNLWQKTSKMIQIIWKRWQSNYLSTL
ncbi:hypothetical protein AVEN_116712-1 [Araneus ventricosus]|uniref:DUF5641 domain-containing protein n=1 Tax=Araneus ventricosus TaxID=182803 RepID=A0A4Y2EIS5_ARAVE|nr:hypothetical protein AVEN_116712-1 [Araneus ventricosus]